MPEYTLSELRDLQRDNGGDYSRKPYSLVEGEKIAFFCRNPVKAKLGQGTGTHRGHSGTLEKNACALLLSAYTNIQ